MQNRTSPIRLGIDRSACGTQLDGCKPEELCISGNCVGGLPTCRKQDSVDRYRWRHDDHYRLSNTYTPKGDGSWYWPEGGYCQPGGLFAAGVCCDIFGHVQMCGQKGHVCPPNHICCRGECLAIDDANDGLISNPDHCGGQSCGSGHCCIDNKCAPAVIDYNKCGYGCGHGYICLSGKCIQASRDPGSCRGVKCPSNSLCIMGKCVPMIDDGRCHGGCETGNICIDGMCLPIHKPLSCKPSCPAGTICIEDACTAIGNPSQCTSTGLKCPPGFICVSNRCVPWSQPALYNSGGKACPADTVCVLGNCVAIEDSANCGTSKKRCAANELCLGGICTTLDVAKCVVSTDCTGVQYCDKKKLVCVEPEVCEANTTCRNGDKCFIRYCMPLCSSDQDCAGWGICGGDHCIPTCNLPTDCPNDLLCNDGVCIPRSAFCRSTDDCKEGQLCDMEDRICVPRTGCEKDK